MDLRDLPDFPESHLRAVENKIKYLKESAHAMMDYRNALVSMSRLLTVILRIIFSLLPSFEVLDFEPSSQIFNLFCLMFVTDGARFYSTCTTTAHAELEYFLQGVLALQ